MISRIIRRPIAITMFALVIVVLGIVGWTLLPVSLMPQIDIGHISIRINAPNISARQLQNSVVAPLRSQLMQTPNLEHIEAVTKDGSSTIFMQFSYGTDIDYTFIDVNERVDRAMGGIDRSIDRPTVVKSSLSDIPVFFLNLTYAGSTHSDDQKMIELSDFASSIISKRLEQLPEVAFVDISGRLTERITIIPNQEKLSGAGVGVAQLESAIRNSHIDLGNLSVVDGQYTYNIRFNMSLQTKADIENVKLNIGGRLFILGEFAQVIVEPVDKQEIVRSDARRAITMAVIKQSDARMEDLNSAVTKLIENIETDYPEIELTVTSNQTELLDYSIGNLRDNLILGALLACFVIFIFMQDLRTPLLITITVPLSLLLSLLGFYVLGISINIISLSGLMLGLGMMVDNSIIVIDNISQRWDRGDSLFDSVSKGTSEVFGALLSSVLTTCAVFLPLIFIEGVAGALFYDQAVSITIGLFSSLIVAMTFISVYYYLIYRDCPKRVKNKFVVRYGIPEMTGPYEKSLKWVFRHQSLFWIMTVVVLIGGALVYPVLDKQSLPDMQKNDVVVVIDWNEPLSVEQNDERVQKMISSVSDKLVQYTSIAGSNSFALSHTPQTSKDQSRIYLKAQDASGIKQVVDGFTAQVALEYPNAACVFADADNIFNLIMGQKKATLIARLHPKNGRQPNFEELNPLVEQIRANLAPLPIAPVAWQEHVMLYANRDMLSLYKISLADLQRTLQTAFNQNQIMHLNQSNRYVSVVIGGHNYDLEQTLHKTTIRSADGVEIALEQLIRQSKQRDLRSIIMGASGEYYPLDLNVELQDADKTMTQVRQLVEQNKNFDVVFVGDRFESQAMIEQLLLVLIVSVLLLYFILASQFESMIQPIIILSEITVDLAAALIVLWAFGQSLNLMSMIGLIVMSGIVINDSILKVDTFNRLRKDGATPLRAVLMGGQRRLKPILMTSITTIMAITPFLFTGGMGNDLQRPLSIAIIAGMVFGTLFSVYGIPVIYYHIYRKRK